MFNEYKYKTAWCPICRQGAVEFVKEEATEHMNLFINNDIEFAYKGFSNKEDEIAFNDKVYRVIELLKLVASHKYVIEVDYEFC